MRKIFHKNMAGFSLVEILIAVAVIAIITAIAIPNLSNAIQKSKRSRAVAEIKGMVTSLASLRSGSGVTLTAGENIPISSVVTAVAFKGPTKDPWGGDYLFTYRPDQQEFIILSLGKDRLAGASNGEFDSDIVFRNMQFIAPAAVAGQ